MARGTYVIRDWKHIADRKAKEACKCTWATSGYVRRTGNVVPPEVAVGGMSKVVGRS